MNNNNINNSPEIISLKEKWLRFNENKIRNKNFFLKGGYAVIITAVVLAAIITVNYLVSALSKKVNLEFDLSGSKTNSLTSDNAEYLQKIKDKVTITVCGTEKDYSDYLMTYSQKLYQVTGNEEYFKQTLHFLKRYGNINGNISLKFVDVQSAAFTAITQQYPNENFAFGDILVSSDTGKTTRYKHLQFKNIYNLSDPSGYAAYGYDYYDISGNSIETALTGAISYVTSDKTYRIALYKGHSNTDYTSEYKALLEANNYEVEVLSDSFLNGNLNDYDAVALMAPSTDFLDNEIAVLSDYLENGKEGGKGIVFFADAANPALPNLYKFLKSYGINAESGTIFETNAETLPTEERRTALYSLPNDKTDYTEDMNGFITGYNIPMSAAEQAPENITLIKVATTTNTIAVAPAGSENYEYNEENLKSFDTVVEAKNISLKKPAYIFAFSSIEFISSEWAENANISNKNLVLAATEISANNVANGVSFVPKTITSEGYSDSVNEAATNRIKVIFEIIIPAVIFIIGIVVFIKRRNTR